MTFDLTDLQQTWRNRADALGRQLSAHAGAAEVVRAAAAVGLIVPDADVLAAAVAVDALATESSSAAVVLALQYAAAGALGGDAMMALSRGERVAAFTVSTEDLPVVDGASLSGRASWVGPLAAGGLALVAGRSGEELHACAVSLDAPGTTVESIDTAALRGVSFGHVRFDRAACEPLGSPLPLMARVRVLLAAAGLGMGHRALREALTAARGYNRRGAGGEQTVQGLLADAAPELDAAMLLIWKAAGSTPVSLAEASMAKLAATEAAQRAVARATQVVGADSFRTGHIVERLAQDVRAMELFAGRTEALREAVARETLPRM
jgi:alkylation response protein AidB-like acyl-CoA dehydrogenase